MLRNSSIKYFTIFVSILLLFTSCAHGKSEKVVDNPESTNDSTPASTPTATQTSIPIATPTISPDYLWLFELLGPSGATYAPHIYKDEEEMQEHFSKVISYTFDSDVGCEYKSQDEFSSFKEYNEYANEQIFKKEEYVDTLIREGKIDNEKLYVHFYLKEDFQMFNYYYVEMDGVITNRSVINELLQAILDLEYVPRDIDYDQPGVFYDQGSYMIICGEVDGEIIELFNTFTNLPSYGEDLLIGITYAKECYEMVYSFNELTDNICDAAFAKFIEAYFSAQHYPVVFD